MNDGQDAMHDVYGGHLPEGMALQRDAAQLFEIRQTKAMRRMRDYRVVA